MHTAVEACPRRKVQRILRIVDAIYAAACREATWDQALAKICRFGSLDGGALSSIDAFERRPIVLASCGLRSPSEPGALHGLLTGDSRFVDGVLRSTPGAVFHGASPISASDWMPTNGSISWACVNVGRDERRMVCLEVHAVTSRAPGYLEPDDLLRQLAPHLVRAWRLGTASRATPKAPLRAAAPSPSRADVAPAADLAGLPQAARLRSEFGLTKAEARLALRLAEGSSLASAAQAFDVKLTTIRSQLQQVFAKTGTCRQTELVAMLLSRGYGSGWLHWTPYRSTQAEMAFAG